MNLKIDFSQTEEFPLIDEGIYTLRVTDCELKESENTGSQYLEFWFEVVGGDWDKTKIPLRNMLNKKDRNFYLRSTLQALGYKCEGIIDLETDSLKDRVCRGEIHHREYNGKVYADITAIYPMMDDDIGSPSLNVESDPW